MPVTLKGRTEELAGTLAQVALALEVTDNQALLEQLVTQIAARWRESAIPEARTSALEC